MALQPKPIKGENRSPFKSRDFSNLNIPASGSHVSEPSVIAQISPLRGTFLGFEPAQ